MLKLALVGAGVVFAANMAAQTDFVQQKLAADPTSVVWTHANVLVGALGLLAANRFGLI
jgi:hypothetical protein